MKREVFRQVFAKILQYQILWKLVQWEPSCYIRTDELRDGQTDRRDGTNSRFSQLSDRA